MSVMWMSLVEMNVWIRQRSAPRSASAARSMSPGTTRARAAITGPRTLVAISCTASNSPSLETGKPASRTSTPRRASCSAISTFSARVSAIPGACSPSRSVVSKIRTTSGSLPFIGDHLLLGMKPGHHRTQLAAHALELRVAGLAAKGEEVGEAGVGLPQPLLGEGAVLDLGQDLAHALANALVHDAGAARVVAPLGGVGDRVPHPRKAALVDQVDDQLHLVQALEVGDLGLVAGVHERLEP